MNIHICIQVLINIKTMIYGRIFIKILTMLSLLGGFYFFLLICIFSLFYNKHVLRKVWNIGCPRSFQYVNASRRKLLPGCKLESFQGIAGLTRFLQFLGYIT